MGRSVCPDGQEPETEERSLFEQEEEGQVPEEPKHVRYNPVVPIETFDVIVTDECHRSIYNLWRGVLEYFEESEKVLRVDRKGVKMDIVKKRRAKKAGTGQQAIGLYETLVEAGQPLAPEELFKRVGLKIDEQPESVEVFSEELRVDVEDALIAELRPDNEHVLLEALEPSAEVLARMEEEEGDVDIQRVEQKEQMVLKQPTLWDV